MYTFWLHAILMFPCYAWVNYKRSFYLTDAKFLLIWRWGLFSGPNLIYTVHTPLKYWKCKYFLKFLSIGIETIEHFNYFILSAKHSLQHIFLHIVRCSHRSCHFPCYHLCLWNYREEYFVKWFFFCYQPMAAGVVWLILLRSFWVLKLLCYGGWPFFFFWK